MQSGLFPEFVLAFMPVPPYIDLRIELNNLRRLRPHGASLGCIKPQTIDVAASLKAEKKVMKQVIIFFLMLLLLSCSQGIFSFSESTDRYYESATGHLFSGNKLWLNLDSTYRLIIHGPSTFKSIGTWTYNKSNREILLTPGQSDLTNEEYIDTMWINVEVIKMKVVNDHKLLYDGIIYILRKELH